jgi:peptide/nickel transport system substrate-binding protein
MTMNRHFYQSFGIVLFLAVAGFACQPTEKEDTVDFKRTDNAVAIRVLNDADVLNPVLTSINTSQMVADQVFQSLLTLDPETLETIPQLAVSRPQASNVAEGPYAGGLKFTFDIHEEAKWADGSPVTAEDYVFTLKVFKIPGLANPAYQVYLSYLVDVEVDDNNPKKFHVYFNEQTWQAEEIAANLFHILPKYVYDENNLLDNVSLSDLSDPKTAAAFVQSSEAAQNFIEAFKDPKFSREVITGSGPYEFGEWASGQRIVLNKKENWWGDALADEYPGLQAYPDQIVFRPIPEDVAAITALKSEEIDLVIAIPPADYIDMQNQDIVSDKYQLYNPESLAHYFLYVNTSDPKLSDKNVRKALAYAIDKQTIIDEIYEGFGRTTASPVALSSPDYNKELSPIEYDPEKAKSLLKEAGWEDSNNNGIVDKMINGALTELSIEYGYTAGRATSETLGLLVKDFAQAVGIDIQPTALEFTQGIARLNQKDYELFSGGLQQQPSWNPKQLWHSSGANRTAFGNAELDQLIDEAELIMDPEERRPIYLKIQEILYDEQPIISLMVPQNRLAIHKRFKTPISAEYPNFFPNLIQLRK